METIDSVLNIYDFIMLEHFWQFMFLIFLTVTSIGFAVFHLFWTAYPDMVLDKLSLIKWVGTGVSKTKHNNEKLEKTLDHIENIEEKYEMVVNKVYRKTFYPIMAFLALNSITGYVVYYVLYLGSNIDDSSMIINIVLFVMSIFIVKKEYFK